MTQISQMAGSI